MKGAEGGGAEGEARVSIFRNSLNTVVNGYFFTFFGWLLPKVAVSLIQVRAGW